jgi:NADH:ubiquinone oxidoreductase subunit 3 (subunit A)
MQVERTGITVQIQYLGIWMIHVVEEIELLMLVTW